MRRSSIRSDGAPPSGQSKGRSILAAFGVKRAFTLIEVMIASGILFACLFAILAVLSQCLANARALQRSNVDPGMLAAQLSLTNKLVEGPIDIPADLQQLYPDYRWSGEVKEASTNGLFEVDLTCVHRSGDNPVESRLNILLWRPDSQRGVFSHR